MAEFEGHPAPPPKELSEFQHKARCTVVETVYHQRLGEQPTVIAEANSSSWLDSDEQPYYRVATIADGWCKLSFAWLDGKPIHELSLKNVEGAVRQTIASQEEHAELQKRVLLVSFDGSAAHIEVSPGRSCRFKPIGDVFVSGGVRIAIGAVPE